jgi:CRISPR-associated protein Cas1
MMEAGQGPVVSELEPEAPLAISAMAEVLYCPKNFWLRTVGGAQDINASMVRGALQDEARQDRSTQRRGETVQRRQVDVHCDSLGLTGRVDVLEQNGAIWPVEYKSGPDRHAARDEVQLCAYAMALEETLDISVDHGFVYSSASGRRRRVEFTPQLRHLVASTTRRARALLRESQPPDGVNDARCPGCALFERCMPWTVEGTAVAPADPRRVFSERTERVSLIVDRPGAWLGKDGERIKVTVQRETLAEVSVHKLEAVTVVGAASLSAAALRLAWDESLIVHHLSAGGTYLGAYLPASRGGGPVRRAQYRLADDPAGCLSVAKAIVTGKARNQGRLLVRWARSHQDPEVADYLRQMAHQMRVTAKGIRTASDADALRGSEGSIARRYWSGMAQYLRNLAPVGGNWFEHRNRRPPRDPVNAALSFAYAMLLRDCVAACNVAGLDPHVGVYHTEAWGRPSLALDLCEEFRPVLVDRLVVSMFRLKALRAEDHFEAVVGGIYLNDAGRSVVYSAWDEQRRTAITHPLFGFPATYRRCIEIQARLLAKVVIGETTRYQPFVLRG